MLHAPEYTTRCSRGPSCQVSPFGVTLGGPVQQVRGIEGIDGVCRDGTWSAAIAWARIKAVLGRSNVSRLRCLAALRKGTQLPAMVSQNPLTGDCGEVLVPMRVPRYDNVWRQRQMAETFHR